MNLIFQNLNNINYNANDITINQFKNIFVQFLEKAKERDAEFELVKKEFKDSGAEYRITSKEVNNTLLRNNPLLKN